MEDQPPVLVEQLTFIDKIMCTEDELKKILVRVDNHFSQKEKESDRILNDIQKQLAVMQKQQDEYIEILKMWKKAKGFAKITKYLFYLILGIGALITAIKSFPITFK